MKIPEVLTRQRKVAPCLEKYVEGFGKLMAAPYVYLCGPLMGVIYGTLMSKPVQRLSAAANPRIKVEDLGSFTDRFMSVQKSIRQAFGYEPAPVEPESSKA